MGLLFHLICLENLNKKNVTNFVKKKVILSCIHFPMGHVFTYANASLSSVSVWIYFKGVTISSRLGGNPIFHDLAAYTL